jgi:hypothetical protein
VEKWYLVLHRLAGTAVAPGAHRVSLGQVLVTHCTLQADPLVTGDVGLIARQQVFPGPTVVLSLPVFSGRLSLHSRAASQRVLPGPTVFPGLSVSNRHEMRRDKPWFRDLECYRGFVWGKVLYSASPIRICEVFNHD